MSTNPITLRFSSSYPRNSCLLFNPSRVGAAVAVTSERRPTLGWSLFLTLSEYSRLVQHVLMHGYIPSPPKVNLIDV